jgi:hypothetical protein
MARPRYQKSMNPTRRGTPASALYENTDDLVERLKKLLKTKSQAKIADELGTFIGTKVDPSSISNIVRRKFPSSRLGYPLAEMYGWPLPPVARARSSDAEGVAKLEQLRALAPDRYDQVLLIIDGELLQVEGERLSRKGRDLLRRRERGVREIAPKSTPEDEE